MADAVSLRRKTKVPCLNRNVLSQYKVSPHTLKCACLYFKIHMHTQCEQTGCRCILEIAPIFLWFFSPLDLLFSLCY